MPKRLVWAALVADVVFLVWVKPPNLFAWIFFGVAFWPMAAVALMLGGLFVMALAEAVEWLFGER